MKSFNEVYEQVHKESFHELEMLRKKRNKQIFLLMSIIALIIGTVVVLANGYSNIDHFKFGMFGYMALFFSLIIILIVVRKSKYTPMFKEKAIKPFIKNMDENFEYNPKGGISSVVYRQGEFERYDRYYAEDLITGKLDGKYNFQMSEVHTEEESTDSDGNTSTYTLFHGLFGLVECAKDIGTTFKIRSDKGVLGKLFKGKTKVEMDSQEFEKYFDVYGDNKIVVMQLLTSDVMNTMMDFIKQSRIKYEITIKSDEMYIRFHTGNMFEPKLFKSPLDYNMLKEYYDIIKFVLNVTKEINKVIENMDI